MRTSELWFAELDPTEGNEQNGKRPVLIISGNAMNSGSGLAIVCPLTTKIKNFVGNIVLLPDEFNGLTSTSEILVFQVRTISKNRLIKKIGYVSSKTHKKVIENFIKICTY